MPFYSMLFDAIAAPLVLLAVALPFLFAYTQAPLTNFWPLMASWACVAFLLLLGSWQLLRGGGGRQWWGLQLAGGLGLAAVLAAGIGLVQYFWGDPGLAPWLYPSQPGQALGNLRQRNQQATLMNLGVWVWLWWQLQRSPAVAPARTGAAPGPGWGWVALAVAWLALGGAATASRTAAVQWLVMLALLLCWQPSLATGWAGRWRPPRWGAGPSALHLALAGLALFVLAAWALPELLWRLQGVQAEGLYERITDEANACTSRRVLWANVLTLIAQKPWLGWGWGELDYAHYVTLFEGPRFCVLLDNAHNLPLHLAVELGLPVALALCGGALWASWRARPWRETVPARQLAWGVLALVAVHSLVEFPLWYGPFQLVSLLALALLLWPAPGGAGPLRYGGAALMVLAAVALLGLGRVAAEDFHRVSQLYRPAAERDARYREDPEATVGPSRLFADQRHFATLTTLTVTRDNAAQAHALALDLLHFSPEPLVLQRLIESAVLLGLDDEAAFHLRRYRRAYSANYAQWRGARGLAGGAEAGEDGTAVPASKSVPSSSPGSLALSPGR